jgi:two-component system sensor histidine kinase CpxA
LSTLLLCLVTFSLIGRFIAGRAVGQAFDRIAELQIYQARAAYERGGPAELARYLKEWHDFMKTDYYLTDSAGTDLVTGANRSGVLGDMARRGQSQSRLGDRFVVGKMSADGRYHLIAVSQPPFSMASLALYQLTLLAFVVALFWLLAVDIASPIRRLARAVKRFGGGDLTARVNSNRTDEIGELTRSFNEMAERIETLVIAERQLLADVSHELRSPLVRLTFAAELIRTAPDRDAAVSGLRHEIDRLSELVSTLLEMTRAEGNPGSAVLEQVQLNELLREIAADSEVEASARGCSIEMTATEDIQVIGDPELLRRAAENILRNALRYAPSGSLVEVGLHRAEDGGAVISIRDSGPGVPEDLLPRIFDPFFRADPSRDEATGGVGLGLAIASRAVRLHHGHIGARDAHPGLIVTVTLPPPPGWRPANLCFRPPSAQDRRPEPRSIREA